MSGAQNQARMRVTRGGLQDLARLLYSESGIPIQKSCSVTKCNLERSNRFRNTVQLTIQLIPAECYDLIRISRSRFVKSTTGGIDDFPEHAPRWAGNSHHPDRMQ